MILTWRRKVRMERLHVTTRRVPAESGRHELRLVTFRLLKHAVQRLMVGFDKNSVTDEN